MILAVSTFLTRLWKKVPFQKCFLIFLSFPILQKSRKIQNFIHSNPFKTESIIKTSNWKSFYFLVSVYLAILASRRGNEKKNKVLSNFSVLEHLVLWYPNITNVKSFYFARYWNSLSSELPNSFSHPSRGGQSLTWRTRRGLFK